MNLLWRVVGAAVTQGQHSVIGYKKHWRVLLICHHLSDLLFCIFSFSLFSLPFFLHPSWSLMSVCKRWLCLMCMLCIGRHVPGVGGCRKQRTSLEPGKPLGGPPRRNIVGCRIQHIWKEGSMFTTQQPPRPSANMTTAACSLIILTWFMFMYYVSD